MESKENRKSRRRSLLRSAYEKFYKTWVIARLTAREAMRQPVFFILLSVGALLILSSFFLPLFTIGGEDRMMIKDMNLATITLCGLLVAILSSSNVVAQEIEKKTAFTVLSKPITRQQFVVGKFFGVALAILVAVAALGVVFYARYYLYYRHLWGNTLSPETAALYKSGWNSDRVCLFQGLVLSFLQVSILAAIAVAISTRLPMAVNASFCLAVFVLGHMMENLVRLVENRGAVANILVRITALILPNLGNTNIASSVSLGEKVAWAYIVLAAVYCLLYIVLGLVIAVALFQEREVG